MSDPSPLRRKIGTPRPEDAPQLLTPERAWRRAVTHGLMRAVGLEATVEDVAEDTLLPEALADTVPEGALVALLDGPAGYGVAVLSAEVLAALLEIQTMGRVQTRSLTARAVTALDAALVADPLDGVLAAQEALADAMGQPAMVGGYRFATRIDNLREIALSLDDAPHDRVSITLSAGPGGPRRGRLDIVLPQAKVAAVGGDRNAAWTRGLETRLMGAQVVLRAELGRLSLPVRAIQAFKPGDTLPLSRHAIGALKLVAPGGHTLCQGQLGQSGGRKAIRLGAAPQDFAAATVPRGPVASLESADEG